jgi:hypothetical protein
MVRGPKEDVVGDARFENFPIDPFDDTRFADMIRKSLREVVEATLARVSGSAENRQNVRAAGERLGNALVAYAAAPNLPDATRKARVRTTNAGQPQSGGDSDGHARAFRAMAGVRQ